MGLIQARIDFGIKRQFDKLRETENTTVLREIIEIISEKSSEHELRIKSNN
jgi:hypothetical protein